MIVAATLRGLVSGGPMSSSTANAFRRSGTHRKTGVGSPPTIVMVTLVVTIARSLSFGGRAIARRGKAGVQGGGTPLARPRCSTLRRLALSP